MLSYDRLVINPTILKFLSFRLQATNNLGSEYAIFLLLLIKMNLKEMRSDCQLGYRTL